ncbi:MAG TPA: response regulator [Pedobacter sp.]|nr:response regulator [Pedobacter sp.]
MFEKVLVAEDHEMMNQSLRRTLEDLQIPAPDHAYYCDITLSKLKKALQIGQPYDLLVTDLYFEVDGSTESLPDGIELIRAAKEQQSDLKILVFSAESRPAIIRSLFDELGIDGYVRKARNDAQQLKAALELITQRRRYYPSEFRAPNTHMHNFTDYDKTIIRLIFEGMPQKDIPTYLTIHKITPTSLSSVEKRLNQIKTSMGFSNNEQLAVYCREMGLI